MALLSADMEFLLLRILAIRQPRRSALPHERLAENLGGVGSPERTPKMIGLQSVGLLDLLETLETETTRPGLVQPQTHDERSKVRQWTEIEKWGRFPESPRASLIEGDHAQCGR